MPCGRAIFTIAIVLGFLNSPVAAQPSRLVWAWERSEALDALPPGVGVAVVTGFIRVQGGLVAIQRGRRFPLTVPADRPTPTFVVHIEIGQREPLDWTDRLRDEVTAAALAFARGSPHVQIDMEVRQSQRATLLDVLCGVRAALAPGTTLSMTALASWCGEHWLDTAPVDEVVPMLFRMGRTGPALRARLAAGGDLDDPRCRSAVGVSLDAPIAVPPGRRVYIFDPRPWDAAALATLPGG